MTAYALSLLTKRKLLIDYSKPCRLEQSLEPNEVDWRVHSVPDFEKLSRRHLDLKWKFDFVRDKFLKINFLKYYKNYDLIKISTGMNLVKHLAFNKNHHKRLKELGFSIETFNLENYFYEWYNKLFKWNKLLEIRFNKMLNLTKPNEKTKLICAQIRIGDRIGIDDLQFTHRNNTKHYWNFIRKNFLAEHSVASNSLLFVTTDDESVIDEAIAEFGQQNVIAFKNRSNHIEHSNKSQCSNLNGVYLDFVMLGKCDMGVLSHSGFGLVGVLLRRNIEETKNFFVYSNPEDLMKSWGKRDNLSFINYSPTILYLEDKLHKITAKCF